MTSAQTLSKLVQDTLVQTFTPDTSTSQWRVALKAEEVATDPGLASSAENVNTVFTSGIGVIVTNVPDFSPVDSGVLELANAAAIESKLPVSGGAAAVENSLYSRFRILNEVVALAEFLIGSQVILLAQVQY